MINVFIYSNSILKDYLHGLIIVKLIKICLFKDGTKQLVLCASVTLKETDYILFVYNYTTKMFIFLILIDIIQLTSL
jgi:hypothetical protein